MHTKWNFVFLFKYILTLCLGKSEETTPDKKVELKRSSMKEKWGLHLAYQIVQARLHLTVVKVWEKSCDIGT
jgi:hypothetical protein